MQNDGTNAEEDGRRSDGGDGGTAETAAVVQIVIVQPQQQPPPPPEAEAVVAVSENSAVKAGALGGAVSEKDEKAKKVCLSRSESYNEQCRVCQQQSEENLVDLGCRCRGELAKAHRSCIGIWFRTRGSNRCEICQQVAVNIPFPESQPSTNYWVWRIDPAFRGPNIGRGRQERGCFSPLWVAFSILIGGLLLDVLISFSLSVSVLPVNIIIGVLIVLGLGTALRLALECCHEWSLRRGTERAEITVNPGYHPAV